MTRKLPKTLESKVIRAYQVSNNDLDHIVDKFNIGKTSIYRILRRNNISVRGGLKIKNSIEFGVISDYNKGKTIENIVKTHDVSSTTIYHILKRNKVDIRGGRLLSKEQFLQRAIEIHGNKWIYDKLHYKKYDKEIKVGCRIHGYFMTTPDKHINQKFGGCKACAPNTKDNNKTFIQKAKKIHGNRYDYSKVQYNGTITEIIIICKKHGPFLQLPSSHLGGHGCKGCMVDKAYEKRVKPLTLFINQSRELHGYKYDYSHVKYDDSNTKIEIICPKHGAFWQSPVVHLFGNNKKGSGCPQCGKEFKIQKIIQWNKANGQLTSKRLRKSRLDFIAEAQTKHTGCNYDYNHVEYITTDIAVKIGCPTHGFFWQTPHHHLSGRNGKGCICPKCAIELVKNILTVRNKEELSLLNAGWMDSDDFAVGINLLLNKNGNGKVSICEVGTDDL